MITDKVSNSPQSVSLFGTGLPLAFSPQVLNFGNQTLAMTSTQQAFTLTNKGTRVWTINLISVVGNNSNDFRETNNCGTSLAVGASCTISVTFTPSSTGTRTAAVSISDNAPASPQEIPLTGVGIMPTDTLSPTSLTFPTQTVFTTSRPQTVTLTNTGTVAMSISGISISGPFNETNNCGALIAPAGSCTISTTFSPTTVGLQTGSFSVRDNATGNQSVTLTGRGHAAE
jgi:hypothetical protein